MSTETLKHNQLNNPTLCPACGCNRLNIALEKPPSPHYAAARCGQCDCFRGWMPKPETLKRRQDQREMIERLLGNPHLTDWDRNFCRGLGKKLSPKQLEILNRIVIQYGGAV